MKSDFPHAAPDGGYSPSVLELAKKPSAFLPVIMSLTGLALVLIAVGIYGVDDQQTHDEGSAAHVWQLLMGGQLPILTFFAFRWLPRVPGPALCVLGVQAVAFLASMAPVFLLGL